MYVSMRNIKLMAWAQTGQYRKILNMLNATIELYKENNGKIVPSTSAEVVSWKISYSNLVFFNRFK